MKEHSALSLSPDVTVGAESPTLVDGKAAPIATHHGAPEIVGGKETCPSILLLDLDNVASIAQLVLTLSELLG